MKRLYQKKEKLTIFFFFFSFFSKSLYFSSSILLNFASFSAISLFENSLILKKFAFFKRKTPKITRKNNNEITRTKIQPKVDGKSSIANGKVKEIIIPMNPIKVRIPPII